MSPKARDVQKSLCVHMSFKAVLKVSFDCGLWGEKIQGQSEGILGSGLERERLFDVRAELGTAAVTEQECGGCFHGMLQVEALAFQPLLDGSFCRQ